MFEDRSVNSPSLHSQLIVWASVGWEGSLSQPLGKYLIWRQSERAEEYAYLRLPEWEDAIFLDCPQSATPNFIWHRIVCWEALQDKLWYGFTWQCLKSCYIIRSITKTDQTRQIDFGGVSLGGDFSVEIYLPRFLNVWLYFIYLPTRSHKNVGAVTGSYMSNVGDHCLYRASEHGLTLLSHMSCFGSTGGLRMLQKKGGVVKGSAKHRNLKLRRQESEQGLGIIAAKIITTYVSLHPFITWKTIASLAWKKARQSLCRISGMPPE